MTIAQHFQCWDKRLSQEVSPGGATEAPISIAPPGLNASGVAQTPALKVLGYYQGVPLGRFPVGYINLEIAGLFSVVPLGRAKRASRLHRRVERHAAVRLAGHGKEFEGLTSYEAARRVRRWLRLEWRSLHRSPAVQWGRA